MAVYLVKSPDGKERLVEAANKASARNHVARSCLDVTVAKQGDLFRVAKAGGDIETAGDETAADDAEASREKTAELMGETMGEPSLKEQDAAEQPKKK